MTFTVNTSPDGGRETDRPTFVIRPQEQEAEVPDLAHRVMIGASVQLSWTPWTPDRWQSLQFERPSVSEAAPVLRGLAGDGVARGLPRVMDRLTEDDDETTHLTAPFAEHPTGDREAWLRYAAVESFDRWLQLSLDQMLVEAERATVQMAVAETLPLDSVNRKSLIEQALGRARLASPGVTRYLQRLMSGGARPPAVLENAIRPLIVGYGALAKEVRDPRTGLSELDSALTAVQKTWHEFSEWPWSEGRAEPGACADMNPVAGAGRDLLDPRLFPARLLSLGCDPDAPEIQIVPAGDGHVHVRVQAFRPAGERSFDDELLSMRLVDHDGREVSCGVLHRPALQRFEADGASAFTGELPLMGSPLDAVRVEVYDEAAGAPPGSGNDREALRRVRKAVFFLGSWRKLVADTLIQPTRFSLTERLNGIVSALCLGREQSADPDLPLWVGGPVKSELQELVRLGDNRLRSLLRKDADLEGVSEAPQSCFARPSGRGRYWW